MGYNILITGSGSCMGQSIFKALSFGDTNRINNVYFTNSDLKGAAFYFNYPNLKVSDNFIVPLATDSAYLDEINKIVKDKNIDIIYSGTQHEIFKLAEYKKTYNNIAVLDLFLLEMSLNKELCFKFLNKNNIDIPKTMMLDDYLKNPFYPAVIKPNTSSSSRNINFVNNSQELQEIHKYLDDDMVVQEFIPGEEYTCGCYLDKFSKRISTIILKRVLTKDGASGYGEKTESKIIEEYLESIVEAYQKEGMDFGHLNIQLRVDNHGVPKVFEINSRLSSTEAPKAKMGYNSVEAYLVNICENKNYELLNTTSKFKKFLRYHEEVYY